MKDWLHSFVRNNYGETSKFKIQQGIHNYWTCQCNSRGYLFLHGRAVAPAWGEAAISP